MRQVTCINRRSVNIRIDLSALRQNLCVARSLSGRARLFATIKADAYGHGAVAVARALLPVSARRTAHSPVAQPVSLAADSVSCGEGEQLHSASASDGADGFAVVTLGEALELRESGINLPILVLQGPQDVDSVSSMVRHRLWPVIHDELQYAWLCKHEDRTQLAAWLKIDTGMGRLGFSPARAEAILTQHTGVRWQGLMTHFACADETQNPFTLEQIKRFASIQARHDLPRSLANSAAVLAWPQSRADWARPGIMLYGCNPLDRELDATWRLRPVMTVEAPLIAVKQLPQGAGIGYGQCWTCPEKMHVGYVAAGYGDGVPRVLDASATVALGGCRCPIIGRVSMDSMAIDLRKCPDAAVGQAVEVWGRRNSVVSLARSAGTISYELLSGIRGIRQYIGG